MLKQAAICFSGSRVHPKFPINRKEVIKMADKKNNCGCGCIPLKEIKNKATKEKKKTKKTK